MKKLLQLAVAVLVFAGCSSAKIEFPDYIADCSSVYDDETYLCAAGEGSTKEQAKINAAAEISRRLKTKITSTSKIETLITDTDGKTSVKETHTSTNLVQTEFEFTDLSYSEFFQSGKTFYVTAYIERKKAWEQYNVKVQLLRETFLGLCEQAEKTDPLSSLTYLAKAEFFVPELTEKINLLYAISPALTDKEYALCKKKIAGLEKSKTDAKKASVVFVEAVEGDYSSIIYTQITASLKQAGLTPVSSGEAAYTAKVSLNLNKTQEGPQDDAVFTALPSIKIEILFGGKTAAAFSTAVQEKTLAFTEEKLKRESLKKLAQKIESDFSLAKF